MPRLVPANRCLFCERTHKSIISKNVASWKAQQRRKAHKKDPDCPPDDSHVKRAMAASKTVEEWTIEQKKRWAESLKGEEKELKFNPFKF